jgi:hypothetical protein
MSRYNVQGTLGSAVAAAGTFTVAYPSGTNKGNFVYGMQHGLTIAGQKLVQYADYLVTAGTTEVTITNRTAASWASGSSYIVSLDERGDRNVADANGKSVKRAVALTLVEVNLGAPIAADADGISASADVDAGEDAVIGGALASAGEVTLDVPRNVVGAWTGAAVVTVYGQDEYGNSMIESSASGTSLTGKKAFKKVTRVTTSANITSATFGTGDVLGLPIFLQAATDITAETQDVAAAVAGTVVVGVTTDPTATTGDPRGTYDPNAACDGAKTFRLRIATSDPGYRGAAHYAG